MGLTKEQREKRTKLVVMAKRGEGNEADVAQSKVEEFDARVAEAEPKHREWGDGKTKKAKPEPVLTEDEKSSALMVLGPLEQALAVATAAGDIHALKDVAAMASALKAGAKARGMGIVSENQAAEVVLRAERAMGRSLSRMREDGVIAYGGNKKALASSGVSNLADYGIRGDQSALWQTLARLSDEDFEALIEQRKASTERIAKVDFYRAATPVPAHQTPVAKQARADIVEALHAEDDIPAVAEWLSASDALLAVTDVIPSAELSAIAVKVQALVGWYNQQKAQRS